MGFFDRFKRRKKEPKLTYLEQQNVNYRAKLRAGTKGIDGIPHGKNRMF